MKIINESKKYGAKAGDIIVLNNKIKDSVVHYLIVEDRCTLNKGFTIVNLGVSTVLLSVKAKTEDELVDKVIKSFEKYWSFDCVVKSKEITLHIEN